MHVNFRVSFTACQWSACVYDVYDSRRVKIWLSHDSFSRKAPDKAALLSFKNPMALHVYIGL